MLFKRCKDTQAALQSPGVVIDHIILDHSHQGFPAGKALGIITLTLQDAPEPLHWPVVDALANTGHTLDHAYSFQLCVKSPVCILEPPVAVEQRMGSRIGNHSPVEGFKSQGVVIGIADDERHDSPVVEIQNGAEIELALLGSDVILELCHISQPSQIVTNEFSYAVVANYILVNS